VDPLGRTLASLLPFSEGALPIEVNLIDAQTIFMRFPIPVAWAVVAALSLLALIKSALGSSYRKHPKRA
jgi:apolipoprotein N-acyltransferase